MDLQLIKNIINKLNATVDLLYQEKYQDGMNILSQEINNLVVISNSIEDKVDQEEILKVLTELLQAMEDRDSTLIADIINYELIEFLQKFKKN